MIRRAGPVIALFLVAGLAILLIGQAISTESFIALLVGVYVVFLVSRSFVAKSEASPLNDMNFLRTVLSAAPYPIFVKDSKGRYLFANQSTADLFGTTTTELIYKTDSDLLSDQEEAESFRQDDLQVLSSENGKLIEEEKLTDCNGIEHWYQTIKLPFTWHEGSETLVLGIASEVTEQKKLEFQLLQSQKLEAIGRLAGGVAHDFNNLLTAILGHVELIKLLSKGSKKVSESADLAERAALRASQLTHRLLSFARQGKHERAIMDVHAVLDETFQILKRSFPANIQIENVYAAEAPYIIGDPVQIQQVVLNLAINARDAIASGVDKNKAGTLKVSTFEASRHSLPKEEFPELPLKGSRFFVLRFEDSGCGINGETISKIFEPFFTTKEEGKGTGLGLSMVYGIVKNHDGVVSVRSKEGFGAIFSIAFPIIDPIEHQIPNTAIQRTVISGKGKILILDENYDARIAARNMLSNLGYDVVAVSKAEDCIGYSSSANEYFDLLLLDCKSTGNGAGKIVSNFKIKNPLIKILATTTSSLGALKSDLLFEDGISVIKKPYRLSELSEIVAESLIPPERAA